MEKDYPDRYSEDVDFTDYARVLMRKKRKILGVFFAFILLAAVYLLAAPEVLTLYALLQIGELDDALVETPSQVIAKINADRYGIVLRDKLGISRKVFPEIRAENPIETKLIKLRVRSADEEMARDVLETLSSMLIEEHAFFIENKLEKLRRRIEVAESALALGDFEIKSIERRIQIRKKARAKLEEEIGYAEGDAETLEEKISTMQFISEAEDPSEERLDLLTRMAVFEKKGQLLRKQELISRKYVQLNSLDVELEALQFSISEKEQEKEHHLQNILELSLEMEETRPTELLVANELLEEEVSPDKKTVVLFSGMLGIFLGIGYALADNWWKVNMSRSA